jgi:hypothetical protein
LECEATQNFTNEAFYELLVDAKLMRIKNKNLTKSLGNNDDYNEWAEEQHVAAILKEQSALPLLSALREIDPSQSSREERQSDQRKRAGSLCLVD